MVEYSVVTANNNDLGLVFKALADDTRRDILHRVSQYQMTVSEIAKSYSLTFAAVSKHLKVLEKAGLIIKNRVGRKHYIVLQPLALKEASQYLEWYHQLWENRLDSLDQYLNEIKE